jgi:hypothetical protein
VTGDNVVTAIVANEKRRSAMPKPDDDIHPGHAVLRALVPDTIMRREFVKRACSRDEWNPADLIRTVSAAHPEPVNVSPEQATLVRAFIESI